MRWGVFLKSTQTRAEAIFLAELFEALTHRRKNFEASLTQGKKKKSSRGEHTTEWKFKTASIRRLPCISPFPRLSECISCDFSGTDRLGNCYTAQTIGHQSHEFEMNAN